MVTSNSKVIGFQHYIIPSICKKFQKRIILMMNKNFFMHEVSEAIDHFHQKSHKSSIPFKKEYKYNIYIPIYIYVSIYFLFYLMKKIEKSSRFNQALKNYVIQFINNELYTTHYQIPVRYIALVPCTEYITTYNKYFLTLSA